MRCCALIALVLLTANIFAQSYNGQQQFVVAAPVYAAVVENDEVDLKFPVTSQEIFPTCCAEVARTLYVQYGCWKNKGPDCAMLAEEQIPSVFSLAAVAAEGANASVKKNNPFPLSDEQGVYYVLRQAETAGSVYAESCYPMRRFRAIYDMPNRSIFERLRLERDALALFREVYNKTKMDTRMGDQPTESPLQNLCSPHRC